MGDQEATKNRQVNYSNNSKVSTGISARNLEINGQTNINLQQVTEKHTHYKHYLPANGLIGSHNFSLDDIPQTLASRNVELELMHQKLEACTASTGASVVILVGMGGAGKTMLAKLYARKNKDDFDNLIWVDAETEAGLEATFGDLYGAVHMSFENEAKINPGKISKLHNKILKHKTLWVFDNVEDFELYKRFSPKSVPPKCHPPVIIITTRIRKGWTDFVESAVNIEKVSLEVCEQYIKQKLGGTAVPTTDIDENWEQLAEYTGGLVIALNAALTAIVERNRTLDDGGGEPLTIAAFLAQAKVKCLQDLDEPDDEPEVRHIYQRLRHLWTDTLEYLPLRIHGPLALSLLNLMAFFPSTGVPLFWLKILVNKIVHDESGVVQALALLVSWSLTDKVGDKYVVHRVLQEAVLRRSSHQDVHEFLNWIAPALKKLYAELRLQGKLMGYFSGIEYFLRRIDMVQHCSNDVFLTFYLDALEMGIRPCLQPLKTIVILLQKEQVHVGFNTAIRLLKNWNTTENFPIGVIKTWLVKQFAAESSVQKVRLVAQIKWESLVIEQNTAKPRIEIMQLIVEISHCFGEAICNSNTGAEISAVLSTLKKLTNFIQEEFKYLTKDFDHLWSHFIETTLNVSKAMKQILQKLDSLEEKLLSSNQDIQAVLIAAEAILHQFTLFEVASKNSLCENVKQRLSKHLSEFMDDVKTFTKSADQVQVSQFLPLCEINRGPTIVQTKFAQANRLALTFEAVIAAKACKAFHHPLINVQTVLEQIASFSLTDAALFSAFRFAVLYAIMDNNLEVFCKMENCTLRDEDVPVLVKAGEYLHRWILENKRKWISKTDNKYQFISETLSAGESVFRYHLQLWMRNFRESNSLLDLDTDFSSKFAKTAAIFGYNSNVSLRNLERVFHLPRNYDFARKKCIKFAEEAVQFPLKEQQEANLTLKCECYSVKYQILLAELYSDNGDLNQAINVAKSAFKHELFCLRENITKGYSTNFLIRLLHATKYPHPEIRELLKNILHGQVEFFGHDHIHSWIPYTDLAVFHCLEGNVDDAVKCLSKIAASTGTDIEILTSKLPKFSEALAATCALTVYMLLWQKRPKSASEVIKNIHVWFERISTRNDISISSNGYKQLLYFLNSVALYQLERYSESFQVQKMFDYKKIKVPENWPKIAGDSFLYEAGVWAKRIQECFDDSRDDAEVLRQKFGGLLKNQRIWFEGNLSNAISIHFNLIVENLLFSNGNQLTEEDWKKLIQSHRSKSWNLNFRFYTNLTIPETNSHVKQIEYSRAMVTSGEAFIACLINEHKRGNFRTYNKLFDDMSSTTKRKCVVV